MLSKDKFWEEPCNEHPFDRMDGHAPLYGYSTDYYDHRYDCPKCKEKYESQHE